MRLFNISVSVIVIAVLMPCFASAKPIVTIALRGSFVMNGPDGKVAFVPITSRSAKRGERIRWEITVKNVGDQPARNLVPTGLIAAPTSYAPSSASGDAAEVEFSIDGGKTWSRTPMTTVVTPQGLKTLKADPSSYTAIRWRSGGTLAPNVLRRYRYDVLVR